MRLTSCSCQWGVLAEEFGDGFWASAFQATTAQ